jgi:hypothetical protein
VLDVPDCDQNITGGLPPSPVPAPAPTPGQVGCGFEDSLTVGEPTLFNNNLRRLVLRVQRRAYTFGCAPPNCNYLTTGGFFNLDTVVITRFVPVIGDLTISGDVPRTLTVPTRSNMVFNVLHDPPGGLSTATWSEGTEMSYRITLRDQTALSTAETTVLSGGGGINLKLATVIAPIGFGIDQGIIGGGLKTSFGGTSPTNRPRATTGLTKSTGFDLKLRLGKAISTSSNPGEAGRASDLILGGGLELQFTEVIRVTLNETVLNDFDMSVCVQSRRELAWEIAKLTTFLYPVREIVDQIIRLQAQAIGLNASGAPNATAQAKYLADKIEDWETILDTYEGSSNAASIRDHEQKVAAEVTRLQDWVSKGATGQSLEEAFEDEFRVTIKDVQKDPFPNRGGQSVSYARTEPFMAGQFNQMRRKYLELQNICARELARVDTPALFNASASAARKGQRYTPVGREGPYPLADEDEVLNPPGAAHPSIGLNDPHGDLKNECDGLADHVRWGALFDDGGNFKNEGVPGTPLISGRQREFDALDSDGTKTSYITYAGGGTILSFTHGITISANYELTVNIGTDLLNYFNFNIGADLTITAATLNFNSNVRFDDTDSNSQTGAESHGNSYTAQVSYRLGDPNGKDKFVVRVSDNLMFGVPVFHTLGGASKCPFEPNTTSREFGVEIRSITPKCPGVGVIGDECLELPSGSVATFVMNVSVNYQNCLLTGDDGFCVPEDELQLIDKRLILDRSDFLLTLSQLSKYDTSLQGLIILIDGVALGRDTIPLYYLPNGQHSVVVEILQGPLALQYQNIQLEIVSACEFAFRYSLCIISDTTTNLCDPPLRSRFKIRQVSWAPPGLPSTSPGTDTRRTLNEETRRLNRNSGPLYPPHNSQHNAQLMEVGSASKQDIRDGVALISQTLIVGFAIIALVLVFTQRRNDPGTRERAARTDHRDEPSSWSERQPLGMSSF